MQGRLLIIFHVYFESSASRAKQKLVSFDLCFDVATGALHLFQLLSFLMEALHVLLAYLRVVF